MSGRKGFLNNYKVVSAGDMSQATVTSSVINIEGLDNIGIQINIISGSPNGAFDVQVSGDYKETYNGNVTSSGNWVSIGSSYTATITAGQPANVYFDLNQLSAPYVRLLYTRSSGSGSFDAFVVGKMV